ncbi:MULTISPECIES: hypothetical protein [Streptomyces]|uniref:hypothetical protein n=1 Tax=Streptomyces TaxID=1883 RepID=UPI00226FE59A|nr:MULTISPECIES: hypothetical protein [unclassified Streptomyces]MCY0923702.1 hypothetical protein [Streptomyces sp. H27-G5]MCY0947743.1 hypothetical protein [Streptomyces sp. H34-AA3]MDJ0466984.1 hypothetical protein [Streptomyces sp. H27-C3]
MSAAGRGYDRTVKRAETSQAAVAPVVARTTPIRITVDVRPTLHRRLKRWCNGTALERDLSSVELSAVFRILADELLEDEKLAEKVAKRLAAKDGKL